LFSEFYWEKKKLFTPKLNTQSIEVVEIVSKCVNIFKNSQSSTVFHIDDEYLEEILQGCDDGVITINYNT
jgi:hypothetical protein